jgi:hypothetical protein
MAGGTGCPRSRAGRLSRRRGATGGTGQARQARARRGNPAGRPRRREGTGRPEAEEHGQNGGEQPGGRGPAGGSAQRLPPS